MYNPFDSPYYTHQHYHHPTYDVRTQYHHKHTYIPYDPNNYSYPQNTYESYDARNQFSPQDAYESYNMREPYTPQEPKQVPAHYKKYMYLKKPTLNLVRPWVRYGLNEAKYTSMQHAMTEVAAITYLIGKGYSQKDAHYIVESWEKNEQF